MRFWRYSPLSGHGLSSRGVVGFLRAAEIRSSVFSTLLFFASFLSPLESFSKHRVRSVTPNISNCCVVYVYIYSFPNATIRTHNTALNDKKLGKRKIEENFTSRISLKNCVKTEVKTNQPSNNLIIIHFHVYV
jgi:hypothetical protein